MFIHRYRARDAAHVPFGYVRAYKAWDRDGSIYLPIGVHWLARLWLHRYRLDEILHRWGVMYGVEEGGYLADLRLELRPWWWRLHREIREANLQRIYGRTAR